MTVGAYLAHWQPSAQQRGVRDCVAAVCGLDASAMVSKSRKREVVKARQLGYWIVRRAFPQLSWPMIGKLFGGRDHSTVIYGERQCGALRARDPNFRALSDALLAEIGVRAGVPEMDDATRAAIAKLVADMAPRPERAKSVPPSFTVQRPRNDFGASRHPHAVGSTNLEDMIRLGSQRLARALNRQGIVCG